MWFETLHIAATSDIKQDTGRILMARHQEPPRWIYTHSCHGRALQNENRGSLYFQVFTLPRTGVKVSLLNTLQAVTKVNG
jgi:hypothetical protein